jgi:hypothetical protein
MHTAWHRDLHSHACHTTTEVRIEFFNVAGLLTFCLNDESGRGSGTKEGLHIERDQPHRWESC